MKKENTDNRNSSLASYSQTGRMALQEGQPPLEVIRFELGIGCRRAGVRYFSGAGDIPWTEGRVLRCD